MAKTTSVLPWSDFHQKKYKQLYDKLLTIDNNINKDNYLLKYNKRKLLSFIKNLELSESSKESFMFMVARYLEINKPNDSSISDFKNVGYKYKVNRQDKEGENQLDIKEKESYQNLQYFKELLKQKNIENIKNKSEHYGYLLTALLTLQPPLRTDFYLTCKFSDGKKLRDGENYLVIQRTKDFTRLFYKIGKDKVSETKYYKSKPDLSVVEIQSKELINIILKSYELYERTYLFQNNNNGQLKADTLLKYLKQFTNINGLTISMMRSIYITDKYNERLSYKDKEQLANKMRNSVVTASRNYYKLLDNNNQLSKDEELEKYKKQIELLKLENNKLKNEITELKKQVENDNINNSEYKKKRHDVISYANKKGAIIRDSTMQKYNINFNEQKKIYY